MTLTCHFITKDWEMESAVLETWNVPESHTICNLATELKTVAEKWAIVNKIHCTITEAASNIKGAVNSNRWNHMVCFAHKLNLVVTCAIDEVNDVKDIIQDVKQNVAFFHRSTTASEKLRMIQSRLNLPEHKLIQHVDTRWNSIFYMLGRYMEQQEAVRTTLCLLDRNDLLIPADKNEIIEEVVKILEPFEAVTTELSAEKYVSASKILPLARGLQRLTATHTGTCSALCDKLTSQMTTRFGPNMEEKTVMAIATLLDPRFKKIPFRDARAIDKMTQRIVSDAKALYQETQQQQNEHTPSATVHNDPPTTSQSGCNPVWEIFDQQAAESTSRRVPTITALSEIEQYFKLPVINRKKDPLLWWKQNCHAFPMLEKVARVYLCTVATSVPSERLFSKAGELISARRNSIKPKNINMFLFLNNCEA